MNNAAAQSTFEGLKAIYTIILALAIGEAFKQFVADQAASPQQRRIHWDRLPALLSFLFLIVPFYHGMLRYFFEAYVNYTRQPGHPPYGLWLMADCSAFCVEAILFFVLSRSLALAQWRRFYKTVVILLFLDLLWVLFVVFAHQPAIVNWAYLDFAALFLLGLLLFAFRDYAPDTDWRSLAAVLPVLLILARTLTDYALNDSFYFPTDASLASSRAEGAKSPPVPRTTRKVRVYFAAPLFSQAQWLWNQRLSEELEGLGFDVILPQKTAKPMLKGERAFNADLLFASNTVGIDEADVLVAVLDEADPDSGTCWECGYAYKTGRPIVAIRTDIRRVGDDPAGSVNLMLSRSCSAYLQTPLDELDDLTGLAGKIADSIRQALSKSNTLHGAKSKPIVYIASPYAKGDRELNAHFQCSVFDRMLQEGRAWPIAPLWAHFQNQRFSRPESEWIQYDKAIMAQCDACVRLSAEIPEKHYVQSESSGAGPAMMQQMKDLLIGISVRAIHHAKHASPTDRSDSVPQFKNYIRVWKTLQFLRLLIFLVRPCLADQRHVPDKDGTAINTFENRVRDRRQAGNTCRVPLNHYAVSETQLVSGNCRSLLKAPLNKLLIPLPVSITLPGIENRWRLHEPEDKKRSASVRAQPKTGPRSRPVAQSRTI